jgi:putative membrane protein
MRYQRYIWCLTLVGLCLGTLQAAVQRQEPRKQQRSPLTNESFVMTASATDLAEIGFSQLAVMQSSNEEVRKFASQAAQEHRKSLQELRRIAEAKHIPTAQRLDQQHRDLELRLSQQSGSQFDREYVLAQVKDHQEAVALFENYAHNGQDQELKAFATQTLPTLKEHLSMVQSLAAKIR